MSKNDASGGTKTVAVMPSYNNEKYIFDAIASVANQVNEVVVVDDSSQDNTGQEVKRAAGRFGNVRHFRFDTNAGPSVASNFAINSTSAEIILFCTADDLSSPERASSQVQALSNNPDAIVISVPKIIDRWGRSLPAHSAPEFLPKPRQKDTLFQLLFLGNFICSPTMATKRETFLKVGMFRPELQQLQDWEFYLRALRAEVPIVWIPKPVISYRKHELNLSSLDNVLRFRVEQALVRKRFVETLEAGEMSDSLLHFLSMKVKREISLDIEKARRALADSIPDSKTAQSSLFKLIESASYGNEIDYLTASPFREAIKTLLRDFDENLLDKRPWHRFDWYDRLRNLG